MLYIVLDARFVAPPPSLILLTEPLVGNILKEVKPSITPPHD